MRQIDHSGFSETGSRQAIAVAHIGFVLTGVVTTLLGPVLPALSARWSLDDAQAGYFFTAQFLGSIMGVALSHRVIARLGFLRSLAAGFLAMAAGVAALGAASWAVGITAVCFYGVGLGITIPTTNLLISDASANRRAAALNVLNFAWGIGAVASPPIIGPLSRGGNAMAALLGLSGLLMAVAFWMLRCDPVSDVQQKREAERDAQSDAQVWRGPLVPLFGALVFFYVGTESAIGGWIASYALRIDEQASSFWMFAPSIFWGALLAGRGAAPAFLKYLSEEKLLLAGLIMACLGITVLLVAARMAGLLAGAFLAGAGFACVFPNAVAMLSSCFGAQTTKVAGPIFALASLGGATVPWVVGFVSNYSGSLRAGLFIALVTNVAMICIQLAIIFALTRADVEAKRAAA